MSSIFKSGSSLQASIQALVQCMNSDNVGNGTKYLPVVWSAVLVVLRCVSLPSEILMGVVCSLEMLKKENNRPDNIVMPESWISSVTHCASVDKSALAFLSQIINENGKVTLMNAIEFLEYHAKADDVRVKGVSCQDIMKDKIGSIQKAVIGAATSHKYKSLKSSVLILASS